MKRKRNGATNKYRWPSDDLFSLFPSPSTIFFFLRSQDYFTRSVLNFVFCVFVLFVLFVLFAVNCYILHCPEGWGAGRRKRRRKKSRFTTRPGELPPSTLLSTLRYPHGNSKPSRAIGITFSSVKPPFPDLTPLTGIAKRQKKTP